MMGAAAVRLALRLAAWTALVGCVAASEHDTNGDGVLSKSEVTAGEQCGVFPSSHLCAAYLDYTIIVDNSYSLKDRVPVISKFLHRFVDKKA